MKKGSITIFFIIMLIIVMTVTSSVMSGIGFTISGFIIFLSVLIIIGAISSIIMAYVKIREKEIFKFVGYVLLAIVLSFFGIKMLKWLIYVLI